MRLGAGGTACTKTRQAEAKMVMQGMFATPMAGEISPNVMFFEIRRRGAQIHANACMMGLDGCNRMGGHGGTGK